MTDITPERIAAARELARDTTYHTGANGMHGFYDALARLVDFERAEAAWVQCECATCVEELLAAIEAIEAAP